MKSKKKDDEFAPWEEEESNKKQEKQEGIPPLTSIKSRVHSKPKGEDQEYLDMYILLKEKERLEKYGKTLSIQHRNVAESWKEVKEELLRRKRELPEMPNEGVEEGEGRKNKKFRKAKRTHGNIKTLDWDY